MRMRETVSLMSMRLSKSSDQSLVEFRDKKIVKSLNSNDATLQFHEIFHQRAPIKIWLNFVIYVKDVRILYRIIKRKLRERT